MTIQSYSATFWLSTAEGFNMTTKENKTYYCYAIGDGNDFNDGDYNTLKDAISAAQEEYTELCEWDEQEKSCDEILLVQEFFFDEDGERVQVSLYRGVVEFIKERSDRDEHGTYR